MVSLETSSERRELVPDWMEEELPGFISLDGSYDHNGFIEYLQDRGYPYAYQDSRSIEVWGVQLGQMLKQEEPLEQEGVE